MEQRPVVLVHGGLYEDVDASTFWGRTGIGAAFREAGYPVVAPNRPPRPRSWEAERDALLVAISSRATDPVHIVAGSNGCSAALRAVVDAPGVAKDLVLCWPPTPGVEQIDAATRERITRQVGGATADRLLAGETQRGILDEELETIGIPVTLVPSEPEDPFHQRATVEALARLLPMVRIAEPTPPALRPNFAHHRSRFVAMVIAAISGDRQVSFDDWRRAD